MPNINELASILKNGGGYEGFKLDFTNVKDALYWTSTTYADNTTYVWSIDFLSDHRFKCLPRTTKKDLAVAKVICLKGGI